jgi:TPR repeat protein
VVVVALLACGGKKQKVYEDAGVGSSVVGSGGSGGGSGSSGNGSGSKQVAAAFDKKCLAGDLEACRNLGVMYSEGVGVPKDARRGAALYAQACNGNLLAGCNHLALLLAEGLGIAKDLPKAVELYQKACDGGYGLACRNLGLLFRDGRGVDKDLSRAETLLDKACNARAPFGCTNAGDLDRQVAASLPEKERVLRYKQMIAHYQEGCNADDRTACRNIGIAYLEGTGLPKTPSAASVWLERGCALKSDRSQGLGTPPPLPAKPAGLPPDQAHAAAGDPIACRVLGMMKLGGVGVARDVEAGKQALKRACDKRDDEACKALANVTGVKPGGDAGVTSSDAN